MAENQDGAEKSEEATSKKKEDARKEGNVAKSMDLSSGVLLVAAVAAMYVYCLQRGLCLVFLLKILNMLFFLQ